MLNRNLPEGPRGRGASGNPDNRYESTRRESFQDGWETLSFPGEIATTLSIDTSRSIINRNDSPDVGFSQSINPYRGCEHGCVYCFARPTHAYLGLSPGLDFESRLFYKKDAPELLKKELSHPRYQCETVALGINTDAYQPVESALGLTRRILEVLDDFQHPVALVTKSSLIERDIDLLSGMARKNLVHVFVSMTTLDQDLARRLEPRATVPSRRLETIRALSEAGIPVGVMVAPVIPVLTEPELESLLKESRNAGAKGAGYVLLRLPLELKELFNDWLQKHVPMASDHIQNQIRAFHQGKEYDSRFGVRMRGSGPLADLLEQRFRLAFKRLGFGAMSPLRTDLFTPSIPGRKTLPSIFPDF
ncbi:MAG: PA0069 family radical SAM protein [Leptospirales bacterium]